MNADGALLSLARHHGIEHGYHDIGGTWHPLSRATAQALLQAMDVACGNESDVAAALDEAQIRPWGRLAPPVVVARDGEALQLVLAINAAHDPGALRWQIEREDGPCTSGAMPVAELEPIDERELRGQRIRARRLQLAGDLPHGYHTLTLEVGGHTARVSLIRTPARCRGPGDGRHWGVSTQLYGLRSQRNWGMGDFGDLRASIEALAPMGASFIGLNPLHALYPDTPSRASPYSPSSRLHINPLYLDVEAVADFAESERARAMVQAPPFQAELARLRDGELVDYPGVARHKLAVLEVLFEHFRTRHLEAGTGRGQEFEAFCAEGGERLRAHGLFEALHEHFNHCELGDWPGDHASPDSPAVAAFAASHQPRIRYFQYLQWQCARQLAACRARARELGMAVGLYLDLAVGSDAFGSDVWAGAKVYAANTSIGAPPDDFAPQGQVWGLPPWRADRLREAAYAPFVDCLRANMRHAGALRIDHVLGLLRLFWVPDGGSAADGAYVHYPVRDLLAIAALESVREECLVVGEDLGTVPDGMRQALAEFGVLSYRVFYFEKNWHGDHSFRRPGDYPRDALVTVSTHDLPTLAGYWSGRDLILRRELGLFASDDVEAEQWAGRERDRARILHALEEQGLRPAQPGSPAEGPPERALVEAVHRYLARSNAALLSVQLEDVLGVTEQVNVPGTVSEQPNWRRKLPLPVEALAGDEALATLARALDAERKRGRG